MSALPIIFNKSEILMAAITCITCGVTFGVPEDLISEKRKDHTNFHCPNGHAMLFPSESDVEKLRKQLNSEKLAKQHEMNLRLEAERREGMLRKRVAHGVCPCCKRSFTNLARHMKSKHPEQASKKPTSL